VSRVGAGTLDGGVVVSVVGAAAVSGIAVALAAGDEVVGNTAPVPLDRTFAGGFGVAPSPHETLNAASSPTVSANTNRPTMDQ
jgi:hypothetical protein